ncbi:MAG: hypothetical protein K2P98_01190 [Neisseriaceae bacterium]|nr:hypothetical protein [Neisseriaceae bacterium]
MSFENLNTFIAGLSALGTICAACFAYRAFKILSNDNQRNNEAFIESQRPHLLIQVCNSNQQITGSEKYSIIKYKNITPNTFENLNIQIKILVEGDHREHFLKLFSENMTMIGFDNRTKGFNTYDEIRKITLDAETLLLSDKDIQLVVSYDYKFFSDRDKKTIEVQRYKWDKSKSEWYIQ